MIERTALCAALALLCSLTAQARMPVPPAAAPSAPPTTAAPRAPETISLVFHDTPIAQLFEMISRRERINIVLGRGVTGNVTLDLYDLPVRSAIHALAEAGGFLVSERDGGYYISDPASTASASTARTPMQVKTMKVVYSDPKAAAEILGKYVTPGGKVTVLESRRILIVEDTPQGLLRIASLLRDIDTQPQQIMIEAKILQITLDQSETFGIDWAKIFNAGTGSQGGTQNLATRGGSGLFLNIVNNNVALYLNALSNKGRVHTLATPKLLALENQEASATIGDELGYKLTTTINNVTAESIRFLETGVILRVTPAVDNNGRIVMKIRPEVSSGTVSAGIPSKATTQVDTQLVADDGQAVLIGGLIKTGNGYRRMGVPGLADIPIVGRLFSSVEDTGTSTETIVVITARVVPSAQVGASSELAKIRAAEALMGTRLNDLNTKIDSLGAPAPAIDEPSPRVR
jgi:type II secretory pathway component GspD/PulD (secretin)